MKNSNMSKRYLVMVKITLAWVFVLLSLRPVASSESSERFENFKEFFIETYWQIHPSEAIFQGYHKNDTLLVVPNKSYFSSCLKMLQGLSDSIMNFKPEALVVNDRTDLFMMRDRVEADMWYLNEFREFEWNPAYYNVGGEFSVIMNSGKYRLADKLKTISIRLKRVEEYYAAARENLKRPVLEHTELAILQNTGALEVFGKSLLDSIKVSAIPEKDKKILRDRIDLARESIHAYIEYLKNIKSDFNSDNSRSFRIGRELYEKKFLYDIRSRYTAEEIYQKALERKKELHTHMAEIARGLWSKYLADTPMPDEDAAMIRLVIEKISDRHVHPDSFMIAIEQQIPELEAFVKKKNLLELDPTKPLVVRKTPSYMEGSGAGVTISAPGPYDTGGNTYYNVSPLTGYSPAMARSYLREYNHYVLQILNIHEAIPGHYAQLVYANKSPSLIKSILANGAMVEGWAVYTERMMLEEGYGNNEQEMWLMYYKWHLRSVCNTILDYSVHILNWPEKVAVKFLMDEAFQEIAEAEGKWRRVKLSQVQLCSYFTGYTEIYDLREELKNMSKEKFNLKSFHEQFLSYGSAPVMYIRELMINDIEEK